MDENNKITPIGITNYRNQHRPFGIKENDRMGHIYVIGKTGTGKSTLLLNMAISDIEKGNGIAVIDPHGDLSETLLDYVPKERIKDVIYFNPADIEYPIAFNPLSDVKSQYHHLVASGLIATFKKIWADSWGPRLEHILRFTLLSLLEYPGGTLLDIQRMLTDQPFRNYVISHLKDPYTIAFWLNEFQKYSPSLRSEAVAPIVNKTGLFQTSIPLRNIIGQKSSSFKMQQVMDQGKILIANLSKGKIGEDATTLIGSVLTTSISLTALYRANKKEFMRKPFFLYVDEAHSFLSLSFADILAEARKYKLSLFLAHQYIEQLHEKIRSAIFGNVGTIISFRVGSVDAEYLAKEFYPIFSEMDLINQPRYSMYLKLLIDGETSRPFSANTSELKINSHSFKNEVISSSRTIYSNNPKNNECK
jgi:type IV secretory pathway TraG/TraD family ATPase VirD4